VRDPNTRAVRETVDPLQRHTYYDRDAKGYVTRITYSDSTVEYHYTDVGGRHLLTEAVDELKDVTTYTYDDFGATQTVKEPARNVTTYDYYDIGLLKNVTAPGNIAVTHYEYDAHRRVTEVDEGYDASPAHQHWRITQTDYDPVFGNVGEVRSGLSNNPLNPAHASTTRYQYNSLGYATLVTEAAGATEQRSTQTVYDEAGKPLTLTT